MTRENLEKQMVEIAKASTVKVTEISYKDADISVNGYGDEAFLSIFLPYSLNVHPAIRTAIHNAKYNSIGEVIAVIDKVLEDNEVFGTIVKNAEQEALKKLGYITE